MLINNLKKIVLTSLALIVLVLGFIAFKPFASAQQNYADAIAVRVLPNPNHYSISRWYQEQGFAGSPQTLTVDGYEAIRDGRTVYVDAANVDTDTHKIYTNIYLISYNQSANAKTADILGQIVARWKFNDNLTDLGSCSIPSLNCTSDQDCGTGFKCGNSSYPHKCLSQEDLKCYNDPECPANTFCDSTKAKIIRDLKRIDRLSELHSALAAYKQANNKFPTLEAGTFVKNKTFSAWPSWQAVLLPALDLNAIVDPINALGDCQGFDPGTCWNKTSNKFYNLTTDGKNLAFPARSRIIYYSTDSIGSRYTLCAGMESSDYDTYEEPSGTPGFITRYDCSDSILSNTLGNSAPVIVDYQLSGVENKEFNGYIKAYDTENNPLEFTLSGGTWTGWAPAPVIKKTNNPNQIKFYSLQAGPQGNYSFNLSISDGQNITTTTTIPIKISKPGVVLQAEDIDHILRPDSPLTYSFIYEGEGTVLKNLEQSSGLYLGIFSILSSEKIGENKFKINMESNMGDLQGLINILPNIFAVNTSSVYRLMIGDITKKIKINLITEPPTLDFSCPSEIRVNRPFACYIGTDKQASHTISYTATGLPAGLVLDDNYTPPSYIVPSNNSGARSNLQSRRLVPGLAWLKALEDFSVRIWQGGWDVSRALAYNASSTPTDINNFFIHGTPTINSSSQVSITAQNEFGTLSSRDLTLKVNDYCGDGVRQYPNTEGKGGYYNDGYEDCDGDDGTTPEPASSSVGLQYACDSNPNFVYPIQNGNYCVFASPLKGGGFCGDGLCETQTVGGQILETCSNCSKDCGDCATNPPTAECGNGTKEAGEICDCSSGLSRCDLGGKTCHDFNVWAVAPFSGLNLRCGNYNSNIPTTTCTYFSNPLSTTSCLYPHQVANNAAFVCENTWYDCDGDVTNGCEAQCCPSCSGKECGSDGCGGNCGSCGAGRVCKNSHCCTPNCAGKECGDNGCGGSCGDSNSNQGCPNGMICTDSFRCEEPNCGNYAYCQPGWLCCTKLDGYFCYPHLQPTLCAQQ